MRIPFSLGQKARGIRCWGERKKYTGAPWGVSGFSVAQDRARGGERLVFLSLAGRAGPTALSFDHRVAAKGQSGAEVSTAQQSRALKQ